MDRKIYDKDYYERHKTEKSFKRWKKKTSTPKGYLLWQFQSILNYRKSKGKTLPFSRPEFMAKFLANPGFLNQYKLYMEKGRLKYLEPKILRLSIRNGYYLPNLHAASRSYNASSDNEPTMENTPFKNVSVDFEKYTKNIISQIIKKAKGWLIPCSSENELWEYLQHNRVWIGLFNHWVRSNLENHLQPVIDRNKKKNGYVLENLMLMNESDFNARIHRQQNWSRERSSNTSLTDRKDRLNKLSNGGIASDSDMEPWDLPPTRKLPRTPEMQPLPSQTTPARRKVNNLVF